MNLIGDNPGQPAIHACLHQLQHAAQIPSEHASTSVHHSEVPERSSERLHVISLQLLLLVKGGANVLQMTYTPSIR